MIWRIQSQDRERVTALSKALEVSPVVAWTLLNRGIEEVDAAMRFLNPSLEHLRPDPPMADMDRAVDRIIRAINTQETIGIHGDYDVDGITGTALLYSFLTSVGARCVYYVPQRLRDGYGLNNSGVADLCRRQATLILTVDCGVSDHEAVRHARELGAEVVIVDHHQVPEVLPDAVAVVNPQRPDCPFHGENLCGVGAAFYLAVALRAKMRELGCFPNGDPNLRAYLDLVALGTVADVVPMFGVNRVLVHFGLALMNEKPRPGLVQLRRVAGVLEREAGVGELSYYLAPRLNAAGRLGSGDPSLKLLLCEDEREAAFLAEELEKLNQTRRLVEDNILSEAVEQVERLGIAEAPAIVVAGQDWHLGVIGIVASRLTELYYRPAAVIGINGDVGKGSLRSIPGINIYNSLKSCSELLLGFGGHPFAAGLSIKADRIDPFRRAWTAAVAESAGQDAYVPSMRIDAEWPLNRCDRKLVDDLARLRPHGSGNPEPIFCARGVKVRYAREGRNDSVQMGLEEGGVAISAFGFRMKVDLPRPGDLIDVVYTPVLDRFNGQESIRLRIRDFRIL